MCGCVCIAQFACNLVDRYIILVFIFCIVVVVVGTVSDFPIKCFAIYFLFFNPTVD